MSRRKLLVRNAVGLAVLLWGLFWCLRRSEYERAPMGDAAYYSQMSWSFFSGQRKTAPISTMHSRRVLGPFLAALYLRAAGFDQTAAFSFPYSPTREAVDGWSREQRRAYRGIETAWTLIDFLSYLVLAAALGMLLPDIREPGLASCLTLALLLVPCLGLLYVYWPQMNDPLALGLGAVGCSLLAYGWDLPGFAVLGLSALAREQILFLAPVLFALCRPKRLGLCILAAFSPYALIALFPVFPNQQPLIDRSTGVVETTPSVWKAYSDLLGYHWRYLFSYRGLAQPAAFTLNLGPLILVRSISGLPRNKLFWPVAALGFVFVADRHMVLLNLPLLLMHRLSRSSAVERPKRLRLALALWIAAVSALLAATDFGLILQAENWFRLLRPDVFRQWLPCASAAMILAVLLAAGVRGSE